MSWIRFDSATMDDEFIVSLSAEEFKAWVFFLLRTKSVGARGSVPISSLEILARNWVVSVESINEMMRKAGDRITLNNGRWYIKNWRKYQEDFRDKRISPEISGDDTEATTVQYSTEHYETGHIVRANFTPPTIEEVKQYFNVEVLTDPDEQHLQFWNYYESKGWMVGRNKMKKWKQAANNWNKRLLQWRKENETAKSVNSKASKQSERAEFKHSQQSLSDARNLQASIENRMRKRG